MRPTVQYMTPYSLHGDVPYMIKRRIVRQRVGGQPILVTTEIIRTRKTTVLLAVERKLVFGEHGLDRARLTGGMGYKTCDPRRNVTSLYSRPEFRVDGDLHLTGIIAGRQKQTGPSG